MKTRMLVLGMAAWLAGCADMAARPGLAAATTPPVKLAAPAQPALVGGYSKVAAPPASRLYFVNLKDGDTVTSPLVVHFGLAGIGVAPAGVEKAATGHHHLLIDVAEIDVNTALAMTDSIRHFGGGQTEARIELKPGTHTLQLLLADHNHIPHHPVLMSERITVTVR